MAICHNNEVSAPDSVENVDFYPHFTFLIQMDKKNKF